MATPNNTEPIQQTPGQSWRSAAAQAIASPLLRWHAGMPVFETIIAAPPGLRPGDIEIARDIYTGKFCFFGQSHSFSKLSPFREETRLLDWEKELHGFLWLRHLAAAGTPLARANARSFVNDWIALRSTRHTGIAWKPEVTANRIIAWLTYSPLILKGSEPQFIETFIRCIVEQAVWLNFTTRSLPADMASLKAKIAAAEVSLCLAGRSRTAQSSFGEQMAAALGNELERQFLADGMHVSRNPDNCINAMLDLLPLYHTYLRQAVQPPIQLVSAIDRIVPMIRFFRHCDGAIGQFNNSGNVDHNFLDAVMHASGHHGNPPNNATPSGYQRLQNGATTLLMDTGIACSSRLSRKAHAGCLSFEMSSMSSRFIINCGKPGPTGKRYQVYARSTAAHSTVTLNDTSSCRFRGEGDSPALTGIGEVTVQRRDDAGGDQVCATHDGYLCLFGLYHQRTIYLSESGKSIHGTDRFLADSGADHPVPDNLLATVRFHLHPAIEARILDNGVSVLLSANDGNVWKFSCVDAKISLDDSVHFTDNNKKTRQIVLMAHVRQSSEIRWVLEQYAPPNIDLEDASNPEQGKFDNGLLDELTRRGIDTGRS